MSPSIINGVFPGLLNSPVVQVELLLVLAALALGFGRFQLKTIDCLFRRCSKHPTRAFVLSSALALTLHALAWPMMVRRAPQVHDEFSYLLSADTFLHGSLANPHHPLWRSFETAHVLFWPNYASMYPPAQGLLLAGGRFLLGDFLAGPWLATALLAGLTGWMLAAWVPRRWALSGAFLVALRFGVFSYWGNSYWGGAVAAIGGTLLFGGLPRVLMRGKCRDAALASAGLVLLAASRPFEGLLATIAAMLASVAVREMNFRGWRPALPAIATAALVLSLGGAGLLYYNWRVTGNPLVLGYTLSMQRYGLAVFPWQSTIATNPPLNHNLKEFYESQHELFRTYQTIAGFLALRLFAFGKFWAFFLGPMLTLPFLGIPALGYSHRWRWILAAGVFYATGLALNPWFLPHYGAPAMGLLLLALIQAARMLAAAKVGGRRPFQFAIRALPVICAGVSLFRATMPVLHLQLPTDLFEMSWYATPPGNQDRAAVQNHLEHERGRHLVLVSYGRDHLATIEWVYNEARIDESKVVWAHDLDPETNARLLSYYRDRRVWRLNVDANPRQPVEQVSPRQ